ncbi:MAG TPA: hypothetical protein VFT04_07335 [Gemmatimonadales bacterium]|nr:hypothetical protein [Gemmatimonadales bacterium]
MTPTADSTGGIIGSFSIGPNAAMAWTDRAIGNHLIVGIADSVLLVGREGAGPGEFRMIADLGWSGDTIWTSDPRIQRFQLFSRTGTLLRSEAVPFRAAFAWTGTDTLIGFPVQSMVDTALAIVRFTLGGSGLDTLALFRNQSVPPLQLSMGGGRSIVGPQPLAERSTGSHSPDGSRWCGVESRPGTEMRLACVAPDGRSLVDTTIQVVPEPLEQAEIDRIIDGFLEIPGMSRGGIESAMHIPEHRPRVARIIVADDGRIWLQRSSMRDSIAVWQRWHADGTEAGTLTLLPMQRALSLRGDSLYLVAADADGIQHVERCLLK